MSNTGNRRKGDKRRLRIRLQDLVTLLIASYHGIPYTTTNFRPAFFSERVMSGSPAQDRMERVV
jgi:hypothetical protein